MDWYIEEKQAAFARQIEEGKAALAVALDETGFSPVKDPRQKQDDDNAGAGDLMQFEHTVVINFIIATRYICVL